MGKEALNELRKEIDGLDSKFVELFEKRMVIAEKIAEIKRENNISVTDPSREQLVIEQAAEAVQPQFKGYTEMLMRSVMALSKDYQRKSLLGLDNVLLPAPRPRKSENVVCAYQGVPGAWSEEAAHKLMPEAQTCNMDYFEDVFTAVKQKKADYGVLPIENSQSGAIGEVYDLLRKFGLYIVGQTWVNIQHCLMAKESTTLQSVREVFSHPEGFRQCHIFLQNHNWDLTTCRNTAVAAEMVRDSQNGRVAAIGSERAAQLNGLNILARNIVDQETNRTRFVLIAAEPEYDADSSVISVTFSTAHRSGALCETLMAFMSAGINLSRIESRPAAGEKYRFFADLQGNIQDAGVVSAIQLAAASSDYFEVLGCFSITK